MIILGLGSNLGNRLENLRQALQYLLTSQDITVIACSPVYSSDALPTDVEAWQQPFLNAAIACSSSLSPSDLLKLIKRIETNMGRISLGHWSPRIIDIDILAWNDQVIETEDLHIPHRELINRPFALWPLADLAPRWIHPRSNKTAVELSRHWGSRFTAEAAFRTHQIRQTITGTKLVGVLNVTPNSFSDGGLFVSPEQALERIQQLVLQGAEIIDIGAEATSQNIWTTHANQTPHDIEWQRLEPILQAIPSICKNLPTKPIISIDTRHVATARKCLDLGVDWINDVSGLEDVAMQQLISEHPDNHWVMMHHLGVPPSSEQQLPWQQDPMTLIKQWAEQRLETLLAQGVNLSKIILDPGIGFGKTDEQNLEILQRIDELRSLNLPILIGHSRKKFLSLFTDQAPQRRDDLTLIASQSLMQKHINYLRVHNIAAHGELLAWHAKTSATT